MKKRRFLREIPANFCAADPIKASDPQSGSGEFPCDEIHVQSLENQPLVYKSLAALLSRPAPLDESATSELQNIMHDAELLFWRGLTSIIDEVNRNMESIGRTTGEPHVARRLQEQRWRRALLDRLRQLANTRC